MSAGVVEAVSPPFIAQMESAQRRQSIRFRLIFVLTWFVILAAIVGFFAVNVGIHFDFLGKWILFILGGIWITLGISVAAIALALVLALFGALGRLSANPVANGIASLYVSFVRGTPLIVQILFIYLALPAAGIVLPEIPTGILALGFNYGAYLTEVFRAGIQAVPYGQTEAARSLGMRERQVMRRVILPQAIRIVIPPVGNDFIAMTKDSALVSFIGVDELLFRADAAGRPYGETFQTIMVAALMYWILTIILSFFQARLERRLAAGDRAR